MSIATSNKDPGIYLEVVFGVGPVSAGDAPRVVAIVGQQSSAGTGTADTPTLIAGSDDGDTHFGIGSEGALMVRAAFDADPACTIYGVALTPPSGGTAATHSGIVFTGTATADGTVTVLVAGISIEVAIASGTTHINASVAVVAAINALPQLPITAANSTATTVPTHKTKGTRGNQIAFSSSGTVAGLTITHASGYLSGGLGSDTLTTAQANMATERYHLIAVAQDLAADLQSWRTHVNTAAGPTVGIRQQVVAGCTASLGTATTLAIAVNTPRVQIAWHYNSYDTCSRIAACVAATRARLEGIDPAAPMSMVHGTVLTGLRPQVATADRPLSTEVVSALNNGLSPLKMDRSANVYLGRSITTRSQDTLGAPNYAVLDTSKVTVPDYFADQLQANWVAFVAQNPKQSPDFADGEDPVPGVATPSGVRTWIYEQQKALEPEMLIGVDDNLANLIVTIPASPAGRFNAKIPLDVVEGNYQLDATISQIG